MRNEVRAFAQDVVRPRVTQNDADAADVLDWEIVQAGHDLGLTRLVVPKAFGGLGYGIKAAAIALEELGAVDAGTALIFGATLLGQAPLLLSGDEQLQGRYLSRFASDKAVLACNAITEEQAGCDLLIPENTQFAESEVTARPDGDDYVISGRKRFITNGAVADFGSVYANISGMAPDQGYTCFVVPFEENVEVVKVADKMGYRACLGTEIYFHDVRVPATNIIGQVGLGVEINIQQMNMARSTVAALSTGVARGAFDLAVKFAGDRRQGGKQLWEHQFTARKIAEMTAKIESARLLYLRGADVADNQIPVPALEPAVAKMHADQISIEVAETAMSIMGARGYLREYGAEKYMREALGARIYEGTPEVLALAITQSVMNPDEDFEEDGDEW
ncbi:MULTISPECIES: acyl-CoA dehydrogenase family protein [Kocuria]|uniref:Acyl-CoA dehydrogenase n=1 Tax=Kocuria subflava TaxID=1736139 RepID=A0A846TNB1_9MICC|nr:MULTISPECIES: acyl-CoA dehydrogenase family protein [Kocuria]NKE10698.1 acyl-CoA dehydrogenase [Kocuria subflava]